MPLYRRTLHPRAGDCDDSGSSYGCSSPPSPPASVIPNPIASPAPSPSCSPPSWLCSLLAPSPSPVHEGAGGRRDQGPGRTHGSGSVGGGGPGGSTEFDHQRHIITLIVVGTAALAFLSLILLGISIAVRRRQQRRRRREALLGPAATPASVTTDVEDGGNNDPEGGDGGVVHHIWYIRTVGLDEAAIDSIAVTRYQTGVGLLGAADCSVCLGEFQDGELMRLLPKCGHAFHVPCIDTWLRAHVNCPLCRSDVLDPAATTTESAVSQSSSNPRTDPDPNTAAAAEQAAALDDAILESEEASEGEQGEDQEAPHMEVNRQEQFSSPEPLPPQHLPFPLPRNVRRAASMDAAIVSTAADVAALERLPEAAPEEEPSSREKRGIGASCLKVSSSGRLSNLSTERLPRSFFSRHCRARSSLLPL
ncbi:hypothetical protein GUJ93_ZPchr0004g40413 [Zizania palustris]|uniref:RING-type E3 ubiquitin transferase n=1 Tax=Zizania palustris TaxID=103762 RepID=A0A8J5SEK0_ZIZPA|nr:hypothetical protein GUJ93_ZPchr0004g40413 [Zizania palustris]